MYDFLSMHLAEAGCQTSHKLFDLFWREFIRFLNYLFAELSICQKLENNVDLILTLENAFEF